MSVITISRGSYSRGKEAAEKLAEKMGYSCISREILIEASREFDIPEIKLRRAIHDAPSVLDRFTHGKERYISYIRKALLKHIQKDNVVYHGLAGHLFLQNIPHVLKVRIIADMETRVKEEMERENITEDKARYILKKDDDERRKWSLQLYGIDTWDCQPYDMVLQIKTMTVDDAVDMIARTAQSPSFRTTPESLKILEDLLLASEVKAAVVKVAPMLKVSADTGVVNISNIDVSKTLKPSVMTEVKSIAEGVEGVENVVFGGQLREDAHQSVNPFHNI